MDTTEQYIKMCDCPEIQDRWEPYEGDYCFKGKSGGLRCDEYLEVFGSDDLANFSSVRICNEIRDSSIWLPRQDQLQEMLAKAELLNEIGRPTTKYKSPAGKVYGINRFVWGGKSGDASDDCGSMEQLWLALVMHELHKKIWDGEKWVDEAT